MVYTAVIQRATHIGMSVNLDHEYTSPLEKSHLQGQGLQIYCPSVKIPAIPALPSASRDKLASKFRQNWQLTDPREVKMCSTNLDDSLTSLGWLHNMDLMKTTVTSPTPPPSPTMNDVDTDVNPNAILTVINNIQPNRFAMPNQSEYQSNRVFNKIDYQRNPCIKPPFSYATLICMAMKETGENKITLASIYQWITEHFMYYRLAEPSWQNSIRHNLSLNKCFQKVPRRKDEPGKGGFWRINPDYSDMLVDGVLKKRRTPVTLRETFLPVKRIKLEPLDNDYKCDKSAAQESFSNEGVSPKDIRNGNFSWNQLLNRDIMVGGVTIKTEDIIDDHVRCLEEETAEAAAAISDTVTPPTSIDSDNSLDDFLSTTNATEFDPDDEQSSPLDFSLSNFALDLTVHGQGLRAPEWWESTGSQPLAVHNNNGMHTPIHESDGLSHPWAEPRLSIDEAIDAFDIKNFFDTDEQIRNNYY